MFGGWWVIFLLNIFNITASFVISSHLFPSMISHSSLLASISHKLMEISAVSLLFKKSALRKLKYVHFSFVITISGNNIFWFNLDYLNLKTSCKIIIFEDSDFLSLGSHSCTCDPRFLQFLPLSTLLSSNFSLLYIYT